MSGAARRRTAIHEAGHAAVARQLGIRVVSASIEGDEETLGRVTSGDFPSWFQPDIKVDGRTRRRLEAHIMMLLAGAEAERLYLSSARGDWSHDLAMAADLADYACGDNAETAAYLKWLSCRTRNLLRTPLVRLQVDALTAALLAEGRLTGRELKALTSKPSLLEADARSFVVSTPAAAGEPPGSTRLRV